MHRTFFVVVFFLGAAFFFLGAAFFNFYEWKIFELSHKNERRNDK